MHRIERGIALLLLGSALACSPAPTEESSPLEPGLFHHPQDVAVVDGRVLVTNTAFQFETLTWGEGSVSVVDPGAREVVADLEVSAPNPQFLHVGADWVHVVSSGETMYQLDSGEVHAMGDGALDLFPRTALEAGVPASSIALPRHPTDPLIGAPGSIVVLPDESAAYIGLGLSAHLYRVDLTSATLTHGPSNPIVARTHEGNDTLALAWHPDGLILVASYNSNQLFRLDPETLEWVGDPIDLSFTGGLEGALDVVVAAESDPDVFVLMGVANTVTGWSSSAGQGGVSPALFPVGPIANRLVASSDAIWAVNSGANSLSRTPLGSMGRSSDVVFAPGSNPWDMALASDGSRGYVTLWATHQLAEFDTVSGEITWVLH